MLKYFEVMSCSKLNRSINHFIFVSLHPCAGVDGRPCPISGSTPGLVTTSRWPADPLTSPAICLSLPVPTTLPSLSNTYICTIYTCVCVSSGVTLISSLSNTHIFIPMCMTCGVLLTLVGLKEVVLSPFNSHTFVQVRGSKHGHILHTSRWKMTL